MFCSCRISTDKRVARSLCYSRASCHIYCWRSVLTAGECCGDLPRGLTVHLVDEHYNRGRYVAKQKFSQLSPVEESWDSDSQDDSEERLRPSSKTNSCKTVVAAARQKGRNVRWPRLYTLTAKDGRTDRQSDTGPLFYAYCYERGQRKKLVDASDS